MDARLARPTDAPLAFALSLDDEAHIVRGAGWPAINRTSRTVLRTLFPLALSGRLWVAKDRGACGCLEAIPRRYVIGWDVTRLVVRGSSEGILPSLISTATAHVQSRGVPRLFARCREAASGEMKDLGFHPLSREYVLLGPDRGVIGDGTLPVDSRYRMPQDAWPLHKLDSEVTPPLVRQLEGLTSMEWSRKIRDMSEIVVEQDGQVVAWIGWGVHVAHNLDQIGMLVHPDYIDSAPGLLQHASMTAPPGRRFIARVRDYQSEVLSVFLEAGFRITSEEILMVKHARVEMARERGRLRVARTRSVPVFHQHLGMNVYSGNSFAASNGSLKEE